MKWKKWIGAVVIAAALGLSLWIVFSATDPQMLADTLAALKPQWLLAAAGCWLGFLFFDALGYWLYYRHHGHPVRLRYSLYVTLMGAFYSGITPGASGGQPMQAYYYKKAGVPLDVGTSGLSARFVLGQLSSVLIVPVIWILHREFINVQLYGVRWLCWLGWGIHLATVVLIAGAAFFRPAMQRLADWLVALGAKLRIVRDPAAALDKLHTALEGYHANLIKTIQRPGELLIQLLLSAVSVASLMSVAVCVYYAFGLGATPWPQVLALAYLLYMSAGFNPLPGATGAQEGGFVIFYRGIFPAGQIGLAMLVWRLFSYYISLLAGAAALVFAEIRTLFGKKEG